MTGNLFDSRKDVNIKIFLIKKCMKKICLEIISNKLKPSNIIKFFPYLIVDIQYSFLKVAYNSAVKI